MAAEKPTKVKLIYFNIPGKAEPIRLLLSYAGIPFEDYRFKDIAEFLTLKPQLPFGQVPALEVTGSDGTTTTLVQSAAIMRYLGKVSGTYPTDALVAATVDALMDQETDAFVGATVISYTDRFGIPMDEDQKAAASALYSSETIVKHLGFIEATLSASPTGWLAGTPGPSPADFVWACRFAFYLPSKGGLFPEAIRKLAAYPKCQSKES